MGTLEVYEVYKIATAILVHFKEPKYDCIDSNFILRNVSKQSFLKRKDRRHFSAIAKAANDYNHVIQMVSSHCAYSSSFFVGNILAEAHYKKTEEFNKEIFQRERQKALDNPFEDGLHFETLVYIENELPYHDDPLYKQLFYKIRKYRKILCRSKTF